MYKCFNEECTEEPKSFSSSMAGMSTLMGWLPRYDEQGRPLSADPNYKQSHYTCDCCGTTYNVVSKGWLKRVFKAEDFDGYLGAFDEAKKAIACVDEDSTPDYVKEYNKKVEANRAKTKS